MGGDNFWQQFDEAGELHDSDLLKTIPIFQKDTMAKYATDPQLFSAYHDLLASYFRDAIAYGKAKQEELL